MIFYLGSHHASQRWYDLGVPLFVSRRTLSVRKKLPRALTGWALDSGGFTELSMYGEWSTTPKQYVQECRRFADEIGHLDWVAPQDWMCEDFVLAKTRKTLVEHQALTIQSYLTLREALGALVVPVLQGQHAPDYLQHIEQYAAVGVDVTAAPVVGVGTVCRRSQNLEACAVLRPIAKAGVNIHAFGIKGESLLLLSDVLTSADSMAWSFRARRDHPLRGCVGHKACNNCPRYAMRWRGEIMSRLGQQRLEVVA